jgi:hypothetical protein
MKIAGYVGSPSASAAPHLKDILALKRNTGGDMMIELKRIPFRFVAGIQAYFRPVDALISIVHESHFGIFVQSGYQRIPRVRKERSGSGRVEKSDAQILSLTHRPGLRADLCRSSAVPKTKSHTPLVTPKLPSWEP